MMLQREMTRIAARILHVSNCGIEHPQFRNQLNLLTVAYGSAGKAYQRKIGTSG